MKTEKNKNGGGRKKVDQCIRALIHGLKIVEQCQLN